MENNDKKRKFGYTENVLRAGGYGFKFENDAIMTKGSNVHEKLELRGENNGTNR